MALTKTIAEVKELLPNFLSNLSKTESFPVFSNAEYKYLVPVTGAALYNSIHGKYNTAPETFTADESSMLKMMRLVSVAYAYKDGLATGHIKMTDFGTKKLSSSDTDPVFKWEYEKLESNLQTIAYDGTEVLLKFLFEKKPALWTASDEYKSFNSLLIKTGTDFTDQYRLFQPMRTYFNIRTAVADVQELYMRDGLGPDLLNYIVGKSDPDTNLTPIIRKLKKALAYYSIKHCCEIYSVAFSDQGFTILSTGTSNDPFNEGRRDAGLQALQLKMQSAEKNANDFFAKAKFDLVKYYKTLTAPVPDSDFKTAFEAGPLNSYIDPGEVTTGNEKRKGVFRFG